VVFLAAGVSLGVSNLAQARLEAVELTGGYNSPYFHNGFPTNPLEDCFRRLVSEANRHSIRNHQVNSNLEQEKLIKSWLPLTLTYYRASVFRGREFSCGFHVLPHAKRLPSACPAGLNIFVNSDHYREI
jgi:hypothetical protein